MSQPGSLQLDFGSVNNLPEVVESVGYLVRLAHSSFLGELRPSGKTGEGPLTKPVSVELRRLSWKQSSHQIL